ncbi:MAG: hypothetical protein R2751_19665 [Bacteroidales bacterium]
MTPRAINMILPLGVMVGAMIFGLAATGWSQVTDAASFGDHLVRAMGRSRITSVLYAVTTALAAMVCTGRRAS